MALVDVDRHILMEIAILLEKLRECSSEFKIEWEEIQDVRIRTEVIVIDQKDAASPELPKLRERIRQASKVCNSKMIVMDDAMSRISALINHMVSMVEEADTGKGRESYAAKR